MSPPSAPVSRVSSPTPARTASRALWPRTSRVTQALVKARRMMASPSPVAEAAPPRSSA
nr:hypothetical protein [Haliangium ochraceum]